MNLVIDIGNSFSKVALFGGERMIRLVTLENPGLEELMGAVDQAGIGSAGKIDRAVISDVSGKQEGFRKLLKERYPLFEAGSDTPVPVTIRYQTPQTLGMDRLAAVCGGALLFPGNDLLVISAGTCITYDFLTSDGEYPGGAISPGVRMRYRALNHFTGKLPLYEPANHAERTGTTTEASIHSGILNGVLAEVRWAISDYRRQFPEVKIILTGGDINFFADNLKSDIFAVPNLVLTGLNYILEYNAHKNKT